MKIGKPVAYPAGTLAAKYPEIHRALLRLPTGFWLPIECEPNEKSGVLSACKQMVGANGQPRDGKVRCEKTATGFTVYVMRGRDHLKEDTWQEDRTTQESELSLKTAT